MVNTIEELKNALASVPSSTPWEDVKVKTLYHIPTLLNLSRRDVIILKKDDEKATYRKIGDTEERVMNRHSLFAKVMVKKRTF